MHTFGNITEQKTMDFKTIELLSFDQAKQEEFYQDLIGFDIQSVDDGFSMPCGMTKLIFRKTDERDNFYHFAFLICEAHFKDCMQFIKQKGIKLLPNEKSGDEISYWRDNTGRSFYFFDKDNNIVEIITRPSLGYTSSNPWSPNEIIKINEIGTPVEHTLDTCDELLKNYPFIWPEFYKKSFSDEFCWFGDYEGVMLIVKRGRIWYNTNLQGKTCDLRLEIQEKDELIGLDFIDGKFKPSHKKHLSKFN